MMECKKIQERLSAYIDGVLSSEEKSHIDKHFSACHKCREAFSELNKTVGHLKKLEEMEPPSWLSQKIMAKIRKEAEPKKGILERLFYPLHIKVPIEAIAAILIAVTAVYLYKAIEPQKRLAESPTEEIIAQTQLQEKDITLPSTADNHPISPFSKGGQKGDLKKRDESGFEKEKPAPAKEAIDKTDKYTQAPAAPAKAAKKEKAVQPAGISVKEEKRREVAATEPELKRTLGDKKEDVISIAISVKNIDAASREIEKIVIQLKGRIIRKELSENKKLLTVELDAKKVKELLEKLKSIGEIKKKSETSEKQDGIVKIKIEVVM